MAAINESIFNPGTMRYRVILQRPTGGRTADGGQLQRFEEAATVPAAIAFGTGREFFAARAVNAELTHIVTIRTYRGLAPAWRIRFNDPSDNTARSFDIRSVEAVGTMRRYQRLHCRELIGREALS